MHGFLTLCVDGIILCIGKYCQLVDEFSVNECIIWNSLISTLLIQVFLGATPPKHPFAILNKSKL